MYLRAYRTDPEHRRVDGMTREEACERYQRKILTLARRAVEQAGNDCPLEPEDLVSYGFIGLLEAFDRYDVSHGVEFTSFASYRILGQMLDAVRASGGVTRRQRELLKDLEKASKRAFEELGREPTHTEIAEAMGVDMATYWQARDMVQDVELVALPPGGEGALPELPSLQEEPRAMRVMLARDARATLREAIAKLPDRERNVILLYYARDLSLAEIGAVLEVTPSRVCQILSDGRNRLRKALGRDLDVDLFSVEGAA